MIDGLFNNSEFIYGFLSVNLSGLNLNGGEVRTVGGVGEMLSLKAHAAASGCSASALDRIAGGPVVRVELYTGLRSPCFKGTAALGVGHDAGQRKLSGFTLVQHKAVVVSCTVLNLNVLGINILADRLCFAEIEGCSFNFKNLAGGN